MTFTEQLIADLCDADRKHPFDVAERKSYGIVVFSDGTQELEQIDGVPLWNPFERDQTYKED